jgi:hypothetical protein
MKMVLRNKWLILITGLVIVLPLLQLLFFYSIAMNTGLPGRRGGPQDAFRHTYACAVVAKYISPSVVMFVTRISERNKESDYDKMDMHNNMIGLKIGLSSKNLYKAVKQAVAEGQINAEKSDQITWLPENNWSNGL